MGLFPGTDPFTFQSCLIFTMEQKLRNGSMLISDSVLQLDTNAMCHVINTDQSALALTGPLRTEKCTQGQNA